MRYRRFGRNRYFRRFRRKSRYSSYRSKRWNKKKMFNKRKYLKKAIASIAETKYHSGAIMGFISGNCVLTGTIPTSNMKYVSHISVNPYNSITRITEGTGSTNRIGN